ncbi:SpaH/EbpB family LPXTG-anchored major pilin [Hydrogeniiclostridium mannosilyticum]|uniref:SpaH/EbpB family LPXTG-anchored major pilin n=1 Tax=Hydrogeniiclostridium mannosilyticum TaxID=2764322 RepID=UPI00399BB428
MKTKRISKVGAMFLAFVMMLSVMAVPAFAIESADKGTITVNGVEEGVAVNVYKLMDVSYDFDNDQPIDPVYTWVSELQDWVDQNYPAYTDASDFHDLSADDAAAFYDKLAAAIKSDDITLTPAGTRKGSGNITDLEMANYLVLIENGMKVYRPSAVNLIPKWNNETNKWEMTTPAEVTVKATEPTIDKTVNEDIKNDGHESGTSDNVNIGDTINYDLRAIIPTYPENAAAKKFQISDILSEGLTLDTGSIKVYGVKGGQETLLTEGTEYTQAVPGKLLDNTTETSFTLVFDYDKIKGYESIHVDYNAVLNENAAVSNTGNVNGVHLEYSNNPYDEDSYKDTTDKVTVFTYGLDISKVNKEETELLAGAKFELADKTDSKISFIKVSDGVYRVAKANESGVTEIEVGSTGENKGKLKITGLDADTYILTETVAPGGYSKLKDPITIEVKDSDKDGFVDGTEGADNTSGYVTLKVINNKVDFELPTTGGMGTVLFTVGGSALILGAAVLLMVSRKKKSDNA